VGVMAYQMLTGQKPRGMAKPPSRLVKGIAPKWDAWVEKCMEAMPDERFKSADEALAALPNMKACGKRWLVPSLAVAVLLAVAACAVVLFGTFGKGKPEPTSAQVAVAVAKAPKNVTPVATPNDGDAERLEKLLNQSALQRAMDDVKQGRLGTSIKELDRLSAIEGCAAAAQATLTDARETIGHANSVLSALPALVGQGRYAEAETSIRTLQNLYDYQTAYAEAASRLNELSRAADASIAKARTAIQNGSYREAQEIAASLEDLSDYSAEVEKLKAEAARADLSAKATIEEVGKGIDTGAYKVATGKLAEVRDLFDYADETARIEVIISAAQAVAEGKFQQVDALVKDGHYEKAQAIANELVGLKDYEPRANNTLANIQREVDSLRGTLELRRNSSVALNKALYSLVTLGDEFWYVLKVDGVDMCKLDKVTQVKLKPGAHRISIVARSFGTTITSNETPLLEDTVKIVANRITVYSFK